MTTKMYKVAQLVVIVYTKEITMKATNLLLNSKNSFDQKIPSVLTFIEATIIYNKLSFCSVIIPKKPIINIQIIILLTAYYSILFDKCIYN